MNGRTKGTIATVGALAVAALGALGYGQVGDGDGDGNRAGGGGNGSTSSSATCPVDSLPQEADEVIDGIRSGAQPRHPGDDGKHFGNYEGVLPKEDGSYYREYTVDTPGTNHRGARRIVVGGGSKKDPDVWYYTGDHYGSFCSIPDAER